MKYLLSALIILAFHCLAFSQVTMRFEVSNLPGVNSGDKIGIRGNIPPLSWYETIFLTKDQSQNRYNTSIEFKGDETQLEYKYVIQKGEETKWESIDNRYLTIKENAPFFSSEWDVETVIDPSSLPLLSSKELKEDFEIFKSTITTIHPYLYKHNSKEFINKKFKELEKKLEVPMSHGEAYLAFSEFIAVIGCDHTFAGAYYNQSSIIKSVVLYQEDKLPFTFNWINDKMILTKNISASDAIKKGAEILSINDIPSSEILKTILPYINADGQNLGNKIRKAEIQGYNFRYEAFDVLYPLLFPTKDKKCDIVFKNHDEKEIQETTINTISRKERNRRITDQYPDFPKMAEQLWSFKILNDETAYFSAGDFGIMDFEMDWKGVLKNSFDIMKEKDIKNLILDFRDNIGGMDEAGKAISEYYINCPCSPEEAQGVTRFLELSEEIKSNISTWDYWFYDLKKEPYSQEKDNFIFPKAKSINKVKPGKKMFQGDIYALVSGKNASAGYYNAKFLKECKFATLIGQETGGSLDGISGGTIVFIKLPNSSIVVNSPIMGDYYKDKKHNTGVIPDIEVERTVKDIIEGRDAELEKALELIELKKKKK